MRGVGGSRVEERGVIRIKMDGVCVCMYEHTSGADFFSDIQHPFPTQRHTHCSAFGVFQNISKDL